MTSLSDDAIAERLRQGALGGASDRKVEGMAVPNLGPEHPDPYDPDDARRGNPASVYRSERPIDEVEAAATRASTVTHRFGGVRYGLSRPVRNRGPEEQPDGGESDPQD